MTVRDALFACLGVISAASALAAVTTRRIVHAALWLTLCLTTLSGCYLVLGAEFVALVQLLVYVGAVVVLVLFAVMLTRAPMGRGDELDTTMAGRMSALVIAAATGGLLFSAFAAAFGGRTARVDSGTTANLATNLFGRYAWPFEVISLVLLVALVAALAMLGPRTGPVRRTGTAARVTPRDASADTATSAEGKPDRGGRR